MSRKQNFVLYVQPGPATGFFAISDIASNDEKNLQNFQSLNSLNFIFYNFSLFLTQE